jgi:penicillin-binding protein 1A
VVRRIATRDGKVLYERHGDGLGRVVGDAELGNMNRIFRAVVREGTATKAQFGNFDIGGKTGTSQDYRDAWFVGFTPYMVTGVWMGNDDNSPTKNVTGGSLPALVWRDVMEPAHAGFAPAPLPGYVAPVAPPQEVSDQVIVSEVDPPQQQDAYVPPVQKPKPKKKKYLFDFLFGRN